MALYSVPGPRISVLLLQIYFSEKRLYPLTEEGWVIFPGHGRLAPNKGVLFFCPKNPRHVNTNNL